MFRKNVLKIIIKQRAKSNIRESQRVRLEKYKTKNLYHTIYRLTLSGAQKEMLTDKADPCKIRKTK